MKRFLLSLLALAFLTACPPQANAACVGGTCFGIATGNWGTAGTWSITSGGVSCVCTPATGDAIVFDAGSSGKTFTMEAAYSVASLVMSNATTAVWTQNNFTLTVTGNTFTLLASATYAPTANGRLVTFTSTSGTTAITSAGKTFSSVSFNGAGGTFQLQDNMSVSSIGATLTSGTLDLNTKTLTSPLVTMSGSTTRVFNCGVGGTFSWTNTAGGTGFDASGTNISTDGNCTISAPAVTAVGSRVIALGTSLTYAALTATQTAAAAFPQLIITGTTPTITTLTLNGPLYFAITTGMTLTATTFNITGTSTTPVSVVNSSLAGVAATFNVTNSTMTWAAFTNITFGTSAVSPTNCFNLGGNTFNGGTCTAPSGGSGRIIGG